MSKVILVEDLARVEGHGGITVTLDNDAVTDVQFDVFEGPRVLEQLLHGRSYQDVPGIISRICAICSAAHCLTSLKATEAAFGVQVSEQTRLLRELLFRGENIESHALHLFLLAAPDFLGYPSATALARAQPEVVKLGLRLKQLGNTIQELIGGRAIHPVNPVLGGFASPPSIGQLTELRGQVESAVRQLPAVLAFAAALPSSDPCGVPTTFAATESPGDYGYYDTGRLVVRGSNDIRKFKQSDYRRVTNEQAIAHSYAKHSRLDGESFMVGALARLMVRRDAIPDSGVRALKAMKLDLPSNNPLDNNRAQAVELAVDLEYTRAALDRLINVGVKPERPVKVEPHAGTGTAITEAPRGILVHSYTYDDNGRILDADVITPTAINAASIEHHFAAAARRAGAHDLPGLKRTLELVVRAYDPCISCSVHLVQQA